MLRIYNNSDIKFHVTDIDGISDRFIIKFYTTNKDFNICKTENDIVLETTEDEFGNISEKKVLKLNWNELSTIGDGVLNYVLNVYRDDADFDDSVYNKTYSRTTKYYIASNLDVTEEDTESFSQMLAELQAEVDLKANEEDVYTKSEIDEIIAGGGLDPTQYYTKSEIDDIIDAIETGQADLTNYYTKTEIDNKGYLTQHQDISGKQDVLSGTAKQVLIANNVVGFPDDLLIDCGEY